MRSLVHLRVLRIGWEVVCRVGMIMREERIVVLLRALRTRCERVAWRREGEWVMLGPGY
jgi:hypothetical protein